MTKLFLYACATIGLFLMGAASVFACSCVTPESPSRALSQSDIVFSGKVTSIELPPVTELMSSMDPMKVNFEVVKSWKGSTSDTLTVITASSDVSCGYPFVQNEEYLVYATEDAGTVTTGLCTRTKLLVDAKSDIKAFELRLPLTIFSIIAAIIAVLFILRKKGVFTKRSGKT